MVPVIFSVCVGGLIAFFFSIIFIFLSLFISLSLSLAVHNIIYIRTQEVVCEGFHLHGKPPHLI